MSQAIAQNRRFTVLLANEQEGWHQTVRQLLEPQGVETVSARSGREALELIESRPIHVAVLDAQMPQLGGLQVMRELHKHDAGQSHPIPPAILLAKQLTSHLLHEALVMHVFSVLSKPVDFNVLLDTLARVLRRHYENRWPAEGGENGNGEPVEASRSVTTTTIIDVTVGFTANAGDARGNDHRVWHRE